MANMPMSEPTSSYSWHIYMTTFFIPRVRQQKSLAEGHLKALLRPDMCLGDGGDVVNMAKTAIRDTIMGKCEKRAERAIYIF